jgi:transcriptional regulator with PAS, ATPase and Fis domain
MTSHCEDMLGLSALISGEAISGIMRTVTRVALSDAAVLILGESGVGKEVIARALHKHSLRNGMPWVDINVAALPEHLVESELFGYDKGAFSGADSAKPGLFELAHGGTLFLDEVGELDPKMQVKLLRVLDGVPYYRLGGVKKIKVDVRIVASTNRCLEEAISNGRFRSDLFHRLNHVRIVVPPLRERRDEVIPLAEFFLRSHDPGLSLSREAQEALQRYSWPGNLRELKNVVTGCAILANGATIGEDDLPAAVRGSPRVPEQRRSYRLDALEQQTIDEVLSVTGGHHRKAAELLGISSRTLSRKLKVHGTDYSPQKSLA